MNKKIEYINDYLMVNNPISYIQRGGDKNYPPNNIPSGGFPPLFECQPIPEKKVDKREFKSDVSAVTLESIIRKREKIEPFFPTS